MMTIKTVLASVVRPGEGICGPLAAAVVLLATIAMSNPPNNASTVPAAPRAAA
jgi:hypothetical protein